MLLSVRWSSDQWPRLVLNALHRNISLLALAVLVLHILTSVVDSFAPITLKDAVLPFASSYRPLWVGFGALAFDLLIAVTVTSALRRRLGYRAWRAVHWAAYACWPLAIVHGFGTGTDTRVPWMLLTSLVCVAVVLAAAAWRVRAGWPAHPAVRATAAAAVLAVPVGLAIWLPSGPLARGWARRAGTPAALLAASRSSGATSSGQSSAASLPSSFTAQVSGSVNETEVGQGLVSVDLAMKMSGGASGNMEVRMLGQPLANGGLSMSRGSVTAGPPGSPSQYSGSVTGLEGSQIAAQVSSGSRTLNLAIDVSIDPSGQTLTGNVTAQPAGAQP